MESKKNKKSSIMKRNVFLFSGGNKTYRHRWLAKETHYNDGTPGMVWEKTGDESGRWNGGFIYL